MIVGNVDRYETPYRYFPVREVGRELQRAEGLKQMQVRFIIAFLSEAI